jgi:copper resistance protein B
MRAVLAFVLATPLALAAAPAWADRLPYVFEEEPPALPYRIPEGEAAAAAAPAGPRLHYGLFDRLEYAAQSGRDGYAWDFSALWGGDRDRLWLASVGEGAAWGDPDYLELQALYGRAVGGGWDLNAGLRYDAVPAPRRVYLTAGGQLERETRRGDYWLGAFAYFSHRGEVSARLTGIYNHALTKRLIVQPAFELNATAEDVPALGLGRGLSYAEAGLRLRYEIAEAFAPYFGLSWERALGRTARMARDAGEDPEAKSLVLGVRSSF